MIMPLEKKGQFQTLLEAYTRAEVAAQAAIGRRHDAMYDLIHWVEAFSEPVDVSLVAEAKQYDVRSAGANAFELGAPVMPAALAAFQVAGVFEPAKYERLHTAWCGMDTDHAGACRSADGLTRAHAVPAVPILTPPAS